MFAAELQPRRFLFCQYCLQNNLIYRCFACVLHKYHV